MPECKINAEFGLERLRPFSNSQLFTLRALFDRQLTDVTTARVDPIGEGARERRVSEQGNADAPSLTCSRRKWT